MKSARKHKFYIDDERYPPDDSWTVIRNSRTALIMMDGMRQQNIKLDAISLDHDLGGDDTTRPIMYYMCMEDYWPTELYIHTGNPVGLEYLSQQAERYGPEGVVKGAAFDYWGHEYKAYMKPEAT